MHLEKRGGNIGWQRPWVRAIRIGKDDDANMLLWIQACRFSTSIDLLGPASIFQPDQISWAQYLAAP